MNFFYNFLKNKSIKYIIEIDLLSSILFIFISIVISVVIFYLGITIGKTLCNPNIMLTEDLPSKKQTSLKNQNNAKKINNLSIDTVKKNHINKIKQLVKQNLSLKKKEAIYTVQLIALKNSEKAEKILNYLKKKGYQAYLDKEKNLYRVRIKQLTKGNLKKLNQELDFKKVQILKLDYR